MSFVADLKQRKVFRVATVYLVVAWVAVQAASIALPAFDAPTWMLRVVILRYEATVAPARARAAAQVAAAQAAGLL